MGRYYYNAVEQELNQVLLYNQELSQQVMREQHDIRSHADQCILESEQLLQKLGYKKELSLIQSQSRPNHDSGFSLDVNDWSDLVCKARLIHPDNVELEDILTQEEFQSAYRDLQNIEHQFSNATKLNRRDIAFLAIATAIQTVRSLLFGRLSNHLSSIDNRMTDKEGDASVKESKKKYKQQHENKWDSKKDSKGSRSRQEEGKTWKEIVFSGVPYDVIAGAKEVGLGLSGQNHRQKTLGHDPILGWFFGTINILTDTITPAHPFSSYRVKKVKSTKTIVPPNLPYPTVLREAIDLASSGKHLLPASVFRQGLHYKSDFYTKKGLPIPLLEVFAESLSSKLYQEGNDSLQVLQKSHHALSAITAELFNMLIGLIHGLFYQPTADAKIDKELRLKERNLYEVRTRKILLISNSIATTSNVLISVFTKNPKYIDLGGLLVTLSHLFCDIRFITRMKQEFIQETLDKEFQEELLELDHLAM